MNWILTIIIGILCLGSGWILGQNQANKRLGDLKKAIDVDKEIADQISWNDILALKAHEQILLLQNLHAKEYDLAQVQLTDSLRLYYQSLEETVEDGMAEKTELEIYKKNQNIICQACYF